MSEFFEYDPLTGIRTDTSWSESEQKMTLHRTSDVEPVLDYAAASRNEMGMDREGIKRGHWLYAKIPPIVIVQMRAKGIDITNKDHQKRMIEEINLNYPHLKCTTGKMEGNGKLIVA